MKRRTFLTAAAFAAAAGLLAACGKENDFVTAPVTESEAITGNGADAVNVALSETDWPCQNAGAALNRFYDAVLAAPDTAAVQSAYDTIIAEHPAVMARKMGITDMAAYKQRMEEQPIVRSAELPCSGALSMQEVSNRTVQLAQALYGDDFAPSETIDVGAIQEQTIPFYQGLGEAAYETRPTWHVFVLAPATELLSSQAENDLFLFAEFDAITGKLLTWQLYRNIGAAAPYYWANGYQWEYTTETQAQAFDAAARESFETIGITAQALPHDTAFPSENAQSGGFFQTSDMVYFVNLNADLKCIESIDPMLRQAE